MTPSNELSLQDRLSEELGLLPGRISRTFYLLATLDAQASRVRNDLQHTRIRLLENLNSTDAPLAFPSQQLSAMRQLHQVQRQLLADKLFVDKKASEWLARAKSVVNRYNQESRWRLRLSNGPSHHHSPPHPTGDQSRNTFTSMLTPPESLVEGRQRTRLPSTFLDDAVDFSNHSLGLYNMRATGSSNSTMVGGGGHPKRRRISGTGDFVATPGRPPYRKGGK